MLNRIIVAALSLVLLTMPSAVAHAGDDGADVSSQLASYMKAMAEVKGFSGSVAVTRSGQTLFEGGYGFANVEHRVPNTVEVKFRLGSVTKPFTAMAILHLADQGKLSLNDPISKHLSDLPEAWHEVTIHHLLTHTSGIYNYTDVAEVMRKAIRLPATPTEVIATVREMPLEFAPGERFAYSNTGYVILGSIIERVSGETYEVFMRRAIFGPLGLADTGYDRSSAILPGRASGYMERGGLKVNAPYIDTDWPHAAGALYSTVRDMVRWCHALDERQLLSESAYTRMYTPPSLHGDDEANANTVSGSAERYACGWEIGRRGTRLMYAHGGAIHGFQAKIIRLPDEKLNVVVLGNVMQGLVSQVANELAAIALGEEVDLPRVREAVAIDPASFDRLAGRYQVAPDRVVSFRRDGDRYFAHMTGQVEREILPESEVDFYFKEVDAQVSFIMDDGKQRAVAVTLHAGGRSRRAERVDSPAPADR